jgi:PAS domain S-box-containing protein
MKNELERLKRLENYKILDTEAELDFENITQLAAAICDAPISLITFVDKHRQWFKSHYGIDESETPIEYSFCAYAIQSPHEPFIVTNAQIDERFKDNPFVTGAPNIKFYAGIPLVDEDQYALGTLCVIDQEARRLNNTQLEALKVLARQVVILLELRKNKADLQYQKRIADERKNELERLFNINLDLLLILNKSGQIFEFSRNCTDILGVDLRFEKDAHIELFLVEEEKEKWPAIIATLEKEGAIDHVDLKIKFKNSLIKTLEFKFRLIDNTIYAAARDITARRSSEAAVKAQKEQFELAIAGSNDGIWDWDLRTNELFLSPRWKNMLGYEDHELANEFETFVRLLHKDDYDRVFDFVGQYFEGKISHYEIDFRMHHKSGELRWITARGAALRDADGKPYRMAGSHTDITKRKAEEEELLRTKAILEQASTTARVGAFETDITTNECYWSPVLKEIYEVDMAFSPEENSLFAFIENPEELEKATLLFTEIKTSGTTFDKEFLITTAKGNQRWVRIICNAIKNEFGSVDRVFGTIQDIHKYKLALIDALEKERLHNVIVGSKVGTWEWDVLNDRLTVDDRWAEILGYTVEEVGILNYEGWARLVHPMDLKEAELRINNCFKQRNEFYSCELRIRHKLGHWVWVYDSGKVFTWTADGKPHMMYGAHQDISKRKAQEEKLQLFQNLIDRLAEGVEVLKEDGSFFYINKTASERLSLPIEKLHEYKVYDIEQSFLSKKKWETYLNELKHAETITAEGTHVNQKTGNTFPIEAMASYINLDGEGYVVALTRDITERKKTQQELLKSKELLDLTGNIAKIGAWEVLFPDKKTNWSQAIWEIYDVEPDYKPKIETDLLFYKEGENRETIAKAVDLLINNNKPFDLELEIISASGKEKWVRAIGKADFEQNICKRIYGTLQDITERKLSEIQFINSANLIKGVLESTKDIVFAVDTELRYLAFNQNHFNAMKQIYGVDIALGQNILSYMQYGHDSKIAEADIQKALKGEQYSVVQEYGNDALFRTYFEASYNPIRNVNDQITGVAVFVKDITERKRAEQAIKYELSLREILFNISTKYINIHLDNVTDAIEKSLKEIGEFVDADRAYIFSVDMETMTTSMTHEWVRNGYEPVIDSLQQIPIGLDDEWVKYHVNGLPFYVYDAEEYTANDYLRQLWLDQGIKSMLTIPIIENGTLVGFVGFDSLGKSHFYTELEEKLLNLFAQMLVNIRNREQQEKQLINEIEFQKILLNVLAVYINIDLGEVESIINKSLKELGEFINADRAYIFEYHFDKNFTSNTHEWCAPGISSEIENLQELPLDYVSQWIHMHKQNKPFLIENVDAIDEESEPILKRLLQAQQIKSLITVPMMDNGNLVGFIGFDSVKQYYKYSEREQKLLFLLAQMLINIRNRQKREKQLVLQEEKYRNIISNINLGLLEVDNRGQVVLSNKGFEQISGYSEAELLGQNIAQLLGIEAAYIEEVNERRKNGQSDTYEILVKNKQGDPRWWLVSGAPNYNDSGEMIGTIGIHLDITAQKKLENELKHLLSITQNQNNRLRNFAHIVSHNLRSHSVNIHSLLDMLKETNQTLAENELFQLMNKASANLLDTIANLSEVALLNTENLELESVSLTQALQNTLSSISALAINAGLKIENRVTGNYYIRGVPAYVDSILLNIITNSIKYKKPNEPGSLIIDLIEADDFLILKFEDNGLGIDLKRHGNKIFGMYKTFHEHPDARGIGLFITKNQIEAMGGRIEVESKVGEGTTFTLFLQNAKS